MINIREQWAKEFHNARKFFTSKGNTKTKGKLKAKWYNEFKEILMLVEKETKDRQSKGE